MSLNILLSREELDAVKKTAQDVFNDLRSTDISKNFPHRRVHAFQSLFNAIESISSKEVSRASLIDELLEYPISEDVHRIVLDVIEEIEGLNLWEIEDIEMRMKNLYLGNAIQAVRDIEAFKMQGASFLDNFIHSCKDSVFEKIDIDTGRRLIICKKRVIDCFGGDFSNIVFLLFFILDGDIEFLEQVVQTHSNEFTRNASMEDKKKKKGGDNFFQHIYYFLGVYSDVGQYLFEKSDEKDLLRKRVGDSLQEMFKDARLYRNHEFHAESEVNLFTFLQESLEETEKDINPWFKGNLKQTPFDARKLPSLITHEIPREVLARVLIEINEHSAYSLAREVKVFLYRYKQKLLEDKKWESDIPKEFRLEIDEILSRVAKIIDLSPNINTIIERALGAYKKGISKKSKLAGRLEKTIEKEITKALNLPDISEDTINAGQSDCDEYFSPQALVLRLIHPKTILESSDAEDRFLELVEELKNSEMSKNNLVLAKSLNIVLFSDDPSLDVPLDKREESIRLILMDLACRIFDDEIVVDGFSPRKNSDDTEMLFPIFKEEGVGRYFNSAQSGLGSKRIMAAAEELRKLWGGGSKAFNRIINFSAEKVKEYFQATTNYDVFFYGGQLTPAFKDVMNQCFPPIKKGDYVIGTDQEYSGMLDFFETKQGTVKKFSLYKIEGNRVNPKTVDDIYSDIKDLSGKKKPKVIILSTKTRLGDAPCSQGGSRGNLSYLKELIKKIKEDKDLQGIPIMLDMSQSVGRGRSEKLDELGADICLISGSKALGIGSVSAIALSKAFQEDLKKNGRTYTHTYEYTFPIDSIAAMGITLNERMKSVDMYDYKGNVGKRRTKSLRENIAQKNSKLTDYIFELIKEYPNQVYGYLQSHFQEFQKHGIKTQAELKSFLKAFAQSPVHGHRRDYSGIVSMGFFNIPASYIFENINKKLYKEKGDPLSLEKIREELREEVNECIRISTDYSHTKEDFNNLFDVIARSHADFIMQNPAIVIPLLEEK